MPKSIKKKFDDALTFENMLKAYERTSVTKRNSKEAIRYSIDLETNITNLVVSIKNGNYKIGKYRQFIIYEPKKRSIRALAYKDRIVHQWFVGEFIKPFFVPRFIKDTFACIDGRGTHKAVETLQRYMRKNYKENPDFYILKCDIKKYFYNIDKQILFDILKRHMIEEKLIDFTRKMIYEDKNEKIGISIGSYTSQYFANIYLNELDHYIKEELKVKYFVRYMDDFVLLVNTKEEAKYLKEKIGKFINEKLHIEFNTKTNYFPNKMGVNFCGYQVFRKYKLLKGSNKRKFAKKIRKWNMLYLITSDDEELISQIQASWNSWLAHSSHANCYKLQEYFYEQLLMKEFLMSPKTFYERQSEKNKESC